MSNQNQNSTPQVEMFVVIQSVWAPQWEKSNGKQVTTFLCESDQVVNPETGELLEFKAFMTHKDDEVFDPESWIGREVRAYASVLPATDSNPEPMVWIELARSASKVLEGNALMSALGLKSPAKPATRRRTRKAK